MLGFYIKRLFNSANPKVFFDIMFAEKLEGRLVFELNADIVPKTCENFLQLCQGTSQVLTPKGKIPSYKGSKIHRIVPGFVCQGGDITNLNGKGGWSIYGAIFDDENFQLKHTEPGILSMANLGPNTNSSQFFITFRACPSLDGKHSVFGKMISGEPVLQKIESMGTVSGKPRVKITIGECGITNE